MAQSIPAGYQAAAESGARQPKQKFEVDWDADGNYTDESANVPAISGSMQVTTDDEGPTAISGSVADTLTVQLENSTSRYSPFYAAGALYADINGNGGYGKPCKASIGFVTAADGTQYLQQFQGHLKEPHETLRPRVVTFQALGNAGRAAAKRASTVLYANTRSDTYLNTLRNLLSPVPTWDTGHPKTGVEVIPWAWLDDENIWEEMQRVAEAEGGRVYFTKTGTLRFESATYQLANSSSQYTFTTAKLQDLRPRFDYANIYNTVIVKYRPRYIAGLQVVWQSAETVVVPPSSSVDLWAQMQAPLYDDDGDGNGPITPVEGTDWTTLTAGFREVTSDVTVTMLSSYAQRTQIRLTNSATRQRYVEGLQLRGYPVLVVEERTAIATDATSIAAYGERVLEVDNLYVQQETAAAALASLYVDRLKNPRLVCETVGSPGYPWLELGDRVTVSEAAETGISKDFLIAKIDWSYADNQLDLNYLLTDMANLYQYSTYFIVGTTALGAVGRAFY